MDSGLQALLMMTQYHGIAADEAKLRHEFGPETYDKTKIILAAKQLLGLTTKLVLQPVDRLRSTPMPALALEKRWYFLLQLSF
jgi:subfamily B ATP-binding cassette protein HlyB/CyaB